MKFSRVEPAYTSKHGCRLVWEGVDEDDSDTVILNKDELESLVEILKKDVTGTITLEDQLSSILINSDVTQFTLQNHRLLEVGTFELQKQMLEYAKIPHEPQYVHISSKTFYPSVWIRKEEKEKQRQTPSTNNKQQNPNESPTNTQQSLLNAILFSAPEKKKKDDNDDHSLSESDAFRIFATRRSTRKFAKTKVEDWKIDKILAAADTAPTAGNFQGQDILCKK